MSPSARRRVEFDPNERHVERLPERWLVTLSVESETGEPIHAFIVDGKNLRRLQDGQRFEFAGPGEVQQTGYVETFTLPPQRAPWHLVVWNPSGYKVVISIWHDGL